jgi:phospholipid/cholesterol/gamma-HCH transport system substrate-binding protein
MSSKVRLGGFILAALVALGGLVFLLGDKQFLFSSTYDVNTQFENVAGLDQGAPVRAGEASNSLKSITGKIDSGQGTIVGLVNDRALYQNLNTTVAQAKEGVTSFQEDMEALKHNFLLRGFFNKRGSL